MGTTLQNGVYLPNEGERNCYAGLKTNWEILDQKVADVTALQQAVAGALHREIVESLPTTDIDPNTIYMVLSGTSATENVYDEYMYVNNAWELIGTSATDLTNYYTKAEVDGKLLLKASASDLTSHTGDTTIHVTASDKAKWNTVALIKQLRLVNTQVGSATTIAFANIDDTNGIKAGDKCMDLDGRMFEITAVDTANQTVTVGSALIDLALDANVVHTSGNETISSAKYFTVSPQIYNSDSTASEPNLIFKNSKYAIGDTTNTGEQRIIFADKNNAWAGYVSSSKNIGGTQQLIFRVYNKDSNDTGISSTISYAITKNGDKYFAPSEDSQINLGTTSYRWKGVYAQSYYYGSDNVEFSTKFVTTDTAQSITAVKTITDANLELKSTSAEYGVSAGDSSIIFKDKNNRQTFKIYSRVFASGVNNNLVNFFITQMVDNIYYNGNGIQLYAGTNDKNVVLRPILANNNADGLSVSLGSSDRKWKDVQTNLVNGLTPSSLGMPVAPSSTSYVDISSYITVLDSSSANKYTPPSNGYITFHVKGNQVQFMHDYGLQYKSSVQSGVANRGFYPVCAGVEYKIYVTASSIDRFWFIPCQGNI